MQGRVEGGFVGAGGVCRAVSRGAINVVVALRLALAPVEILILALVLALRLKLVKRYHCFVPTSLSRTRWAAVCPPPWYWY